jgi:RNA polymerase sigma-70 factor (ECF subfamily)
MTPPPEDRQVRLLIERAQAGEREAFEALAEAQRERLTALIGRRLGAELRARATVEDVLQETLLRAFRAIGRFAPQDGDASRSFFRWLSGIALKVILEIAARGRKERAIELDFEVPAREVSPSRKLQRQERLERLERSIARLEPDYRTVLTLVRLQGVPGNEAARRLGRSPNAVSHLLLRALRRLREVFGDTESLRLDERPPPESAAETPS